LVPAARTLSTNCADVEVEKQIHRTQKGGRWYMVLTEHLFEFEHHEESQPEPSMAAAAGETL
jgi:hypothetical protein